MPPPAVKSIRDLIYWQYAKIISESAGAGKRQYGFVMDRFKKLASGDISWSTSIREYVKEREKPGECIYCGRKEGLTLDHILPRSRGGPDSPDNAVWVCRTCNSSKGDTRLYEWYELGRRYEVPRIAEGKYLKLLYALHEDMGTLGVKDVSQLCPKCDLGPKCPEEGKLTVYCLEGLFRKGSLDRPKGILQDTQTEVLAWLDLTYPPRDESRETLKAAAGSSIDRLNEQTKTLSLGKEVLYRCLRT